jgi:hypothetical protein
VLRHACIGYGPRENERGIWPSDGPGRHILVQHDQKKLLSLLYVLLITPSSIPGDIEDDDQMWIEELERNARCIKDAKY